MVEGRWEVREGWGCQCVIVKLSDRRACMKTDRRTAKHVDMQQWNEQGLVTKGLWPRESMESSYVGGRQVRILNHKYGWRDGSSKSKSVIKVGHRHPQVSARHWQAGRQTYIRTNRQTDR